MQTHVNRTGRANALAATLAALSVTLSAQGITKAWDGTTGGQWWVNWNWTDDTAPSAGDDLVSSRQAQWNGRR